MGSLSGCRDPDQRQRRPAERQAGLRQPRAAARRGRMAGLRWVRGCAGASRDSCATWRAQPRRAPPRDQRASAAISRRRRRAGAAAALRGVMNGDLFIGGCGSPGVTSASGCACGHRGGLRSAPTIPTASSDEDEDRQHAGHVEALLDDRGEGEEGEAGDEHRAPPEDEERPRAEACRAGQAAVAYGRRRTAGCQQAEAKPPTWAK